MENLSNRRSMKITKFEDQLLLSGKEAEEIDEDLELKTHIIYYHKTRCWSKDSINAYFKQDKFKVTRILKEFQLKSNLRPSNKLDRANRLGS